MPIQIIPDGTEGFDGNFISLAQLKKLRKNFLEKTFKLDPLTGQPRALDPANDSQAVYFKKSEIEKLFNANRGDAEDSELGVRIYFGVYDPKIDGEESKDKYPGQQTVILVCTLNETDLLEGKKNSVMVGAAYNEGQICPPPACKSII
ncbi:hypothetical protein [Flavihumibacter sp. ZG627]|uniref:hypothetical protein n=1 Tax=Flavihumibacter sp. ZG627 TaxID=1463156 RepID=UPI00057CD15E|nr:hypothetical protein [Flavihumibacter sp. ZG627]KIC90818.1 hypothetical protein HY58_07125 [Flavihumibacter sp. ZG627]